MIIRDASAAQTLVKHFYGVRTAELRTQESGLVVHREGTRVLEAEIVLSTGAGRELALVRDGDDLIRVELDGRAVAYLARRHGVLAIPPGFSGVVDALISGELDAFAALASIRQLVVRQRPDGKAITSIAALAHAARLEEIVIAASASSLDPGELAVLPRFDDLSLSAYDGWAVLRARSASRTLARLGVWPEPFRSSFERPEDRDRFLRVARALYPAFQPKGILDRHLHIEAWDLEDQGSGPDRGRIERGRYGDATFGFDVAGDSRFGGSYFMGEAPQPDTFRATAYGLPAGWELTFQSSSEAAMIAIGPRERVLATAAACLAP